MTNDREFCRNFQNDYLIHALSQLPAPQPAKRLAQKRSFAGSVALLRAIAGDDLPRVSVLRRRKVRARAK